MTPEVLYCFPDQGGKRWTPSNGTEGMIFEDAFCSRCANEKWCHTQEKGDKQCALLDKAKLEWPTGGPEEWQYNEEGWPVCTAWKPWRWNQDDDGNWNDPPEPPPYDPNQLCLPFIFDEIGIPKVETVAE